MALRYYQREAVEACYEYLAANAGNPCIVLPTGAGKTHVIVKLCEDVAAWGGRVLILAHVKELIDQAAEKMKAAGLDVGVYSAGLKSRDKENSAIVAGIQSVYKRGLELCGSSPFNMVIIDEAHRIPVDGEGMYCTLLDDLKVANHKLRVVGLTATPYRTGDGMVCRPGHFLNEVCYEANIRELIAGGFLCPLTSKKAGHEIDTSGLHISRGEFVASEMEERFNVDEKVVSAVNEILYLTADRRKVLVFCCGIAHASSVAMALSQAGQDVRIVSSEHVGRDKAIESFKSPSGCKYLVNVNCLTEGFDATATDAVILLRATASPGLYYQMVGRGLRPDPSKDDCLVLDFGGNVKRHGTIDNIKPREAKTGTGGEAPVKACPECSELVHAGLLICSCCGFEFPPIEPNHEPTSSGDSPLGKAEPQTHEVAEVFYSIHRKKGAPEDAPQSMRVSYFASLNDHICDEWVCVEHTGFAWEKAYNWWGARASIPMPDTAEAAVVLANSGALAVPKSVTILDEPGSKFKKIVGCELGEKPLGEVIIEEEEIPW